jgi:serine/threonine-protein kinase
MRDITPLTRVAPDVPASIAEMVQRMLSIEKEKRPQSLREVRDALRDFSDVMATSFGDPVLAPIRRKPLDAESSEDLARLHVSDLKLLGGNPDKGGGDTTIQGPATMTSTESGASVTLSTPRPVRRLVVFGAVALAGVLALAGWSFMRPHAPAAAADRTIAAPEAAEPIVSAPAPSASTPTVSTPTASTPTAAAPRASGRPKPGPAASVAAPKASAGGLVEKPPF